MPWYSILEGTTEVSRVFVLNDSDLALQVKPGQTSSLADHPFISTPSTMPLPTLDDLKSEKWASAKAYRDSLANGYCTTPSGVIEINDSAKLRINSAVQMAIIAKSASQAFSIDWTLMNNTTVTLDADQMIAMGVYVGQFVSSCQSAGTAIRSQIEAATDTSSLNSIDITVGYPSPNG
jgi:hypothetical protein